MSNKFPENFLFGAATSAHQVEGGNKNDWSEWEKENAERLSKKAEREYGHWLPSWNQVKSQAQDSKNYISGQAADHYNKFEVDFDIAKELGHNAHRLSIEWSRIEPEEGKFKHEEVEHYRNVIRALRERGIEPMITLWHWTLPIWVSKNGGVSDKYFPYFFARYSSFVISQLGNEAVYWMTLNEPTSVTANSYLRGVWPPQKKGVLSFLRASKVLAEAHKTAYRDMKSVNGNIQVGYGNIMSFVEPNSSSFLDRLAARFKLYWANNYFFDLVGGDYHDFYTLQYYFHEKVSFPHSIKNKNEKVSDMGWELYPEGLYNLLLKLKKLNKPIFITENGLADMHDKNRAWFIRESLRNVKKALDEGVDVRGYFYWSLLDNFEWDKGFWPRFGLIEVDYETMERKIRPSAWEYKKIIEEGL